MVEAFCLDGNFLIKFYKQLSLTSSAMLHNSGITPIQMLCHCLAKQKL